jgi:hypothetical protein
MTTIDRVSLFVHDLCRMDRFGGRCVRKSLCEWEVLDINQWSEEQAVALHQRFPSISARVEANRKSLGGFSVVLQQQRSSHTWISLVICGIFTTVIFSMARFFSFY